MKEKEITKISKYLSYLLRHQPDAIGLSLDDQGWASVAELIAKTTDFELTPTIIELVVETNDKQRFALDKKRELIRANQGHSIDVNLQLTPIQPPEILLHGTAERFIDSIMAQGLSKQNRHHVHLSESEAVAKSVGSRYGKPVLLEVDCKAMMEARFSFFCSANNAWLVDSVPAQYLRQR